MKGKITVIIPDVGKPEVEIMGEIPPRVVQMIPHIVRTGYRLHVYNMRRNLEKVDMSDKGPKLKDMKVAPEPTPDPDVELKMPLTPDQMIQRAKDKTLDLSDAEDLTDEANNPKESETQDAINTEAEGTGGDAEGSSDT